MLALWGRVPFLGRLLVTATLALLVAGAAMLFVAAGQEAAEIRADLRAQLAKELDTLPKALAETIVIGDFATLQQTLESYTARPPLASVSFKDATGIVVSGARAPGFPECPAWFLSLFDFNDVEGKVPVSIGGRTYGELQVHLSAAGPAGRAWAHLKNHMAILLLAIFVDFLGIWLVLRTGLLPLRRLKQGAVDMAAGRLDVRLAPEGDPEFRRVIDAFNRMVESVRGSQGALRASEQRLENIIEGTHVGTWEWNVQTGELVLSERWAEIVGYTLDELAPISVDTWIGLVQRDDLKLSGELLDRHFLGELPYYECEVRMRHKSGHWVWVLDRGKVFSWTDDHKPLQMSGTHQDITERKKSEAALIEAKLAAESANIAKSQFLATMSHEIRTPLNVVLGMAQMLRRQGLAERDRISYAQTILTSGNMLLRLLTDILDLAKVEAGKLSLAVEIISPTALVRETVEHFAHEAQRKGVDLHAGLSLPADALYRADPIRVRQMLSNLVGNAVKFTEAGVIEVTVEETGGNAAEAELEFAISDTGIGVSDQDMAHLFLPFSQVDASSTRRYGGSGLGLSIVRRLAELMRGEAGGSSVPGEGSRFWFRIRVERARSGELPAAPESPSSGSTTAAPLEGRVLVVEDNANSREMLCVVARDLGLSPRAVNDGAEAIDAVAAGEPFDLILMDLQMPRVDGFEATRRIREWQAAHGQRATPVIAVSANTFDSDRERCAVLGMCDFIAKPIDFAAFEATLRRWLPEAAAPGGSTGSSTATAVEEGVRIDRAQVGRLLAELQPMLDDNMFDAVVIFSRLVDALQGSPLARQLGAVQAALERLDFHGAAAALRRFAAVWYQSERAAGSGSTADAP